MLTANNLNCKIVQPIRYNNGVNTLLSGDSQNQRFSLRNHLSQKSLKSYLVYYLSNYLQVSSQELDVNLPFHYYGMNLVEQLCLTSVLEDYLGYRLSNDIVCKHPTIEKLSEYLVQGVTMR